MSAESLQLAIRCLAAGESLSADQAASAFDVIMRGEASAAQIAAVLVGLRVKGETVAEVTGGARALRNAMITLSVNDADTLVDTCGTGGGRVPTFNISTAAALVVAGAGCRVAKHGNRSFTSRCGSADVLEALGVRIDMPLRDMSHTLESAGMVFMFAPNMHPAMKHVGPVRRELAIPTVMNVLGPLANPARAGRQVVGVADEGRLALLAGALAALGSTHALVVHGEPGLDEVSPLGWTRVLEVRAGEVKEWSIDPRSYGLGTEDAEELIGGSPEENASIIQSVLSGDRRGGARAAVLLNAAAALYVAGAGTYDAALVIAEKALDSGLAAKALDRLRRVSAQRTL